MNSLSFLVVLLAALVAVGVSFWYADARKRREALQREELKGLKSQEPVRGLIDALSLHEKSWIEIWFVPILVAVIGAAAALATAVINRGGPDCLAYVDTLLKVRGTAQDNAAAVAAVVEVDWGDLDDECGAPGDILSPLGERPTNNN